MPTTWATAALVLVCLAAVLLARHWRSNEWHGRPPLPTANLEGGSMHNAAFDSSPKAARRQPMFLGKQKAPAQAASGEPQRYLPSQLLPAWECLDMFARTGAVAGVTNLSSGDVRAVAEFLTRHYNRSQILALLDQAVRMPAELVPEDSPALTEFLVNWFQAARGDKGAEAVPPVSAAVSPVVPIGFSATTDASGKIIATAGCLPTGGTTVCGVFENHAWREGVSRVLAVWRNTDQNKVVYQETEPLLPSADSNYVWLHTQEGWPAGHWQLDVFDPARDFTLLATGTFTTQN